MSDKEMITAIQALEASIAKANAAAERLVRCAESISNPVYSVSMQGHRGELQIQAVRHFQGQICITVANPFAAVLDEVQHTALGQQGKALASYPYGGPAQRATFSHPRGATKCSALYGSTAEGDCPLCGHTKSSHNGSF